MAHTWKHFRASLHSNWAYYHNYSFKAPAICIRHAPVQPPGHRAKTDPPIPPFVLKKKLFKHSPLFLHLMCLLATLFVLILHLLWLHRIMKEKKKVFVILSSWSLFSGCSWDTAKPRMMIQWVEGEEEGDKKKISMCWRVGGCKQFSCAPAGTVGLVVRVFPRGPANYQLTQI